MHDSNLDKRGSISILDNLKRVQKRASTKPSGLSRNTHLNKKALFTGITVFLLSAVALMGLISTNAEITGAQNSSATSNSFARKDLQVMQNNIAMLEETIARERLEASKQKITFEKQTGEYMENIAELQISNDALKSEIEALKIIINQDVPEQLAGVKLFSKQLTQKLETRDLEYLKNDAALADSHREIQALTESLDEKKQQILFVRRQFEQEKMVLAKVRSELEQKKSALVKSKRALETRTASLQARSRELAISERKLNELLANNGVVNRQISASNP